MGSVQVDCIEPVTGASGFVRFLSSDTLANASSPKMDLAYKLAAINPHSPDMAFSGVRLLMLVHFSNSFK